MQKNKKIKIIKDDKLKEILKKNNIKRTPDILDSVPKVKNINFKKSFLDKLLNRKNHTATLEKLNNLIQTFNNNNYYLLDLYVTDSSFNSRYIENHFREQFGAHRNYLIKYLHDIKAIITNLNSRLYYIRKQEFQKFINSLVNGKKTLGNINRLLSKKEKENKQFIEKEKDKIKNMVLDTVKIIVDKVKKELKDKQNRKCNELKTKITNWLKIISELKKNKNCENVNNCLNNILKVLNHKSGSLKKENQETIKNIFQTHRVWKMSQSTKIEELIDEKWDEKTNFIIIALLGIITDDGQDPVDLIKGYIDKK